MNSIEKKLLEFEKPGRYIGNELGVPDKNFSNSEVKFAISYPDIYEIGMSNYGIKILYDIINKIDFASCERVFSPWEDFDAYLRESNIPLFSLESKTPIKEFDILGVSIQYELLFSNFLGLLETSQIEIFREKRSEGDPIVICGGPAISNPMPFAPFVDLFIIGEGEEIIADFLSKYRELKSKKIKRPDVIKSLSELPGVFSPEFSDKPVQRLIYNNFANDPGIDIYVIPNIDVVQNKLVVEIMRGCPNKCRFCQAGVIYKASREKSLPLIMQNIEKGLQKLGVEEVTLASLSSGDYSEILQLVDTFNDKYSSSGISVALPSLKVETFNEEVLDKLSEVRKSGLTFAVEAGSVEGQYAINKPVLFEKIEEIVTLAIEKGWRLIKLYFMVGLPHIENEIDSIKEFINKVLSLNKKLKINANISTFVPKSHTPYQFESQLRLEESKKIIYEVKDYYRRSRVSVKSHNPYMSYVEGFIARGDERVGLAVYEAYKNGARFDGWKEKFCYEVYEDAFRKNNITYEDYLSKKPYDFKLPWDVIDSRLSKEYLVNENEKAKNYVLNPGCNDNCEKECTICDKNIKKKTTIFNDLNLDSQIEDFSVEPKKSKYMIEFYKKGLMRFISHTDLLKYFERVFRRASIKLSLTEGFNPHPKIQFSSALPLGLESFSELLIFETDWIYDEGNLLNLLNKYSHDDLKIKRIRLLNTPKKVSLFDQIFLTKYLIKFDSVYYNRVKDLLFDFNQTGKEYSFERKGRVNFGNYKNFVAFKDLNDSCVVMEVEKITPSPKIFAIVQDLFGDIEVDISKQKLFGRNSKGILYDLFEI